MNCLCAASALLVDTCSGARPGEDWGVQDGATAAHWSAEYIQALFKTERAYWSRMGLFPSREMLALFLDAMKSKKLEDVGVEPLADGRGVRITNAGPKVLLDIVALALDCDGEILFPGELPA